MGVKKVFLKGKTLGHQMREGKVSERLPVLKRLFQFFW